MFLQDNNSTAGGPSNLNEIFTKLKNEVTGLQSAIINFEIQAKSISADIFGRGAAVADQVQRSIAKAAQNTSELGVSVNDVAAAFNAVATAMGTNLMLTEENLTTMLKFQKATNVSAEDVGKLTEGFMTVGYSITDAYGEMEKMRQTTNRLGINTAQFMKTVGENIKLMNSYNFRDGVEGFTRMVARSQALRINMTDVKGLAADLLNPEKAIELAASMQMLGGSIGALSDPFQLMNMAQNDMEGLQESIIDAAASTATFNERTGKFDIAATEMRRLRAMAGALGMDYEELANTAVKAAQRQEAFGQLRFTSYTDEEKEMISNMGQLKDGKLMVALGPNDELIDATALGPEEMKKLREQQLDAQKSDRDIAKEQLTTLETIEAVLLKQLITLESETAGGSQYAETTQGLKDLATKLDEQILSRVINSENYNAVTGYLSDNAKEIIDNIDTEGTVSQVAGSATRAVVRQVGSMGRDGATAVFGEENVQLLEVAMERAVERGMVAALSAAGINLTVDGNIDVNSSTFDFTRLTPQQLQDLQQIIFRAMNNNNTL